MPAPHVPAWKRLGLKLKFADEFADSGAVGENSLSVRESHILAENTRLNGQSATRNGEPAPKKRRVESTEPGPDKALTVNGSAAGGPESNGPLQEKARSSNGDRSVKLKKRVSFTSDTKEVDGDTSQGVFAANMDLVYAQETSIAPESVPRPPKKPRTSTAKSTHSKSTDALHYLDQFYSHPEMWKFNKNREVWILKHALSATDIPPSYNLQLAHYMHGLRSDAARSRLLADCQRSASGSSASEADTTHENTNMSHNEEFQRQLLSNLDARPAERQQLEGDDEYRAWAERQRRADILQWSLSGLSKEPTPGAVTTNGIHSNTPRTATEARNGASSKEPVQKKRKNRTAVVEYSSSSSSSSSNSDNDDSDGTSSGSESIDSSSDEDTEPKPKPKPKANNGGDSTITSAPQTNGRVRQATKPPPLSEVQSDTAKNNPDETSSSGSEADSESENDSD